MAQGTNTPGTPTLTLAGKLAIGLFLVVCLVAAFLMARHHRMLPEGSTPGAIAGMDDRTVKIPLGIAYGTEKERWLKTAVEGFSHTTEGRKIAITLIPMGSLEGEHAALAGDTRINVWSPASAVYRDSFIEDWQAKYGNKPFLKEEPLALTPMVFVMWEERYQAFLARYKAVSFQTINKALHEPGGWDAIASHKEWGLFKFGHTNPGESNSGVQALLLAGHSFFGQTEDLTLSQVSDPAFQEWLARLESGTSSDSNSTGNLMREMVLKGPSSYDALLVYENVAIDYLRNAEGRWGALHIIYPEFNTWNENPYYILDASWSTPDQRKAAQSFLDYLLSEPVQRDSINHGFRPADTNVPIRTPDSPWVRDEANGAQIDVRNICPAPKGEVLNNLLASWQRRER